MVDKAVILAGGKSSRMGRDKTQLDFDGKSLLEFQHERLSAYFKDVYVSAKRAAPFAPTVLEPPGEFAPLAGIISCLEALRQDLFFFAVDVPFFSAGGVEQILRAHKGESATLASVGGKIQPLFGIYAHKILGALKEHFARKNYKLKAILADLNVKTVAFSDDLEFFNINTSADYERAKLILKGKR